MRYRITTPTPGFTGEVGAIAFANGQAVIDDSQSAALAYFEAQGYGVAEYVADPQADAAASADAAARIAELEAEVGRLTTANTELQAQAAAQTAGASGNGGTKS